ncbi:MAG: DegT/DnrJ/EryC1/StrS aminotransferase family protein [Rubrivivax sp.]|nr:DegT/DnrJ/EryC1/StrS aminotransferase family protein [Rubrivivax sp.]
MNTAAAEAETMPLPKGPVLGWDNFWPLAGSDLPHVGQLPHRRYTTSGRAALHAALLQMRLPAGRGVLVPTYHCPTMIAPVVEAGLQPLYYPLDADGLPALERIDAGSAAAAGAMFVAHFFGLARSLAAVQAWCRSRGILLVEDCAHCYFGMAGERPVGHWGDYATASLSKFFPVPEGGLLASALHEIAPLGLQAQGVRAQVKAVWDVLDLASRHSRLAGLSQLLRSLRTWRTRTPVPTPESATASPCVDSATMHRECDMGRIRMAPTGATRVLHATLPTRRIVDSRRANYALLSELLSSASGARPLLTRLPSDSVPYVLPLCVDGESRADAVYTRLREERLPVFRWDRRWPGTPAMAEDHGSTWSRTILQVLCHQDLGAEDLREVAGRINVILAATPCGTSTAKRSTDDRHP